METKRFLIHVRLLRRFQVFPCRLVHSDERVHKQRSWKFWRAGRFRTGASHNGLFSLETKEKGYDSIRFDLLVKFGMVLLFSDKPPMPNI